MRRLSERAANSCANAKKPKCRCRCGGALHGKGNHGRSVEEVIAQLESLDLDERGRVALDRLRESVAVQEDLDWRKQGEGALERLGGF
jgi:hypothetical protein